MRYTLFEFNNKIRIRNNHESKISLSLKEISKTDVITAQFLDNYSSEYLNNRIKEKGEIKVIAHANFLDDFCFDYPELFV